MADLTSNVVRIFHGDSMEKIAWPMPANTQLFHGAAVMPNTNGYAVNCTPTASGKFIGFTIEEKDNRTGSVFGGTDGSTTIEVLLRGILVLRGHARSSSNWTLADIGASMYASDGNVFTDSAGTNNIVIGKIVMLSATGSTTADVYVYFEASGLRSV